MLNNRFIEDQITSYLAGECTPEEELAIGGLIHTDSEYKETYAAFSKIWNTPVLQPVKDSYDVDSAWLKVSSKTVYRPMTVVHHERSRKPAVMRVLKYAASIAAVLLLAFTIYQISRDNSVVLKTYATGKQVSSPLALSDGSNIVLNSGSEVKYPEKFGSDNREVYFWGEAFFEIAPDPTRPFVIETGDARIKVLGTSFNVKAHPGSGLTEVVVNTGTVLFYYVDQNDIILGQVILHKGDKGVYNHTTHQLARELNEDVNFISWKTNILVFNEVSLDKVMKVIGEKYGVKFRMDNSELSKLKLTATFDHESLDSVLEVLSLVHKLQFTHNGNDYLVRKVTG